MKLLSLLFLLFSLNTLAQSNGIPGKVISGNIIDSATHERLSYAVVGVFQDNGTTPINGATTDSGGHFLIDNLANGEYSLSISFAGYKTKRVNNILIDKNNSKIELGNILLTSLSNQLKGVEITANKATIENHLDKLIYNPANDLAAQGGGALDVLRKVPMVSVDVDGNVELLGDNNIQFLINGKPSTIFGSNLTDVLQAIPASQIKSIEVMTSPGAKYDATGTAGIINIILKTNKAQGISGNINLSGGTRLENGSANLSVTKKNFNVNVFFSGSGQINSTTLQTIKRTSSNATSDTLTNLLQQGSNSFSREGYQTGASINWDITPKQALVFSVQYDQFNNHTNNTATQQQEITDASDNLLSSIMNDLRSASSISQDALDYSVGYKNKFRKDQELDILYSASIGNNTNNFSQEDQYIIGGYPTSGLISNNPGTDKETNISIDYSQPFSKKFIIETGTRFELDNFSNTVITDTLQDNNNYVQNPGQTYSFNYNRNIIAYYLSANFSLFKDFVEGKAGMRYEYTTATLSGFPNTIPQYGIFSPSFTLAHKLLNNQSIKLSYSYRTERPTYNDLNPFYNISDPHNISSGNPELKPEIGHTFELGYSKTYTKGANIYVAGFYRYNKDDIQSYTTFYPVLNIDGTDYYNVSLNQRYNVGLEVNIGTNIFLSLPITDKFSLRTNIMAADRISNDPGSVRTTGLLCHANLNASYEFGNNWAAEAFGNYRSQQRTIEGYNPSFIYYTIAVRKLLINKKLGIGLTTVNPFNKYVNQTATVTNAGSNQTTYRQIPFRSVGVTITYKFGKVDFNGKSKDKYDTGLPGIIDN